MAIDRTVYTRIDPDRCTGCGLCVQVCPSATLSMSAGKAIVSGDQSLSCGHCMAACPADAVTINAIDDEMSAFETFSSEDRWLPPGEFKTAELVRLMRSRRSCRNYLDRPVDRPLLEDLVRIAVTAPSGTNSQKWTFTIIPDRLAVIELGARIADFYRRLNRLASKGWLRRLLRLAGKKELDHYYRDHYLSVRNALSEWDQTGRDLLFHGAPTAILVGSEPEASCPMEDALLATQNILLGAHSMGLGTCLIGFAVAAMKKDTAILQFLNISSHEKIYAAIAVGYPAENYQRAAGRKTVRPRFFAGSR